MKLSTQSRSCCRAISRDVAFAVTSPARCRTVRLNADAREQVVLRLVAAVTAASFAFAGPSMATVPVALLADDAFDAVQAVEQQLPALEEAVASAPAAVQEAVAEEVQAVEEEITSLEEQEEKGALGDKPAIAEAGGIQAQIDAIKAAFGF